MLLAIRTELLGRLQQRKLLLRLERLLLERLQVQHDRLLFGNRESGGERHAVRTRSGKRLLQRRDVRLE